MLRGSPDEVSVKKWGTKDSGSLRAVIIIDCPLLRPLSVLYTIDDLADQYRQSISSLNSLANSVKVYIILIMLEATWRSTSA